MLKKRYIIIALGIVSILVGTLLYVNLALAGKPQLTYKDAVEIDVFGWATRQWTYTTSYPMDLGIYVQSNFPADLSFIFLPKPNVSNITRIVVVIYATDGIDDFIITINDVDTYVGNVGFSIDLPSTKRIHLNPNLIPINEGINLLRMSGTSGGLSLFKVSLFIEYEYQAG